MPVKKLTALAVEHASTPASGRSELWDAALSGFGLRITSTGSKSWFVSYRFGGQKKRLTLGTFPALSLAKARALAVEAMEQIAAGKEPAAEKRANQAPAPASDTIERVVDEFMRRYMTGKDRTESYVKATRRNFDNHVIPVWEGRELKTITRRDVIELLDRLVDNGKPVAANRVLAAVRKMMNWAVQRDIIAASPASSVDAPGAETRKERALTEDEIRAVWRAADKIGYPFGPFFKVTLLTAQRRTEVAGMRWPELDLTRKLWILPAERTKAGRAHAVPLSPIVVEIIENLPKIGEHVFTTRRARRTAAMSDNEQASDAPISGFSKAKRELDAKISEHRAKDDLKPLANWTIHDLRRTASTGMGAAGVLRFVTERVLNHSDGSVTGIYDRYEYLDEKRDALDKWGSVVAKIVAT